jgi:hypothetical protein
LVALWASIGHQEYYYLWIASGVVGLLLWAWISYRVIRLLLGHKKILGVWFRPGELDSLLDRLEQIAKNGTILQARDMALLDLHRPDWRPHLKKFGEGDFMSW